MNFSVSGGMVKWKCNLCNMQAEEQMNGACVVPTKAMYDHEEECPHCGKAQR